MRKLIYLIWVILLLTWCNNNQNNINKKYVNDKNKTIVKKKILSEKNNITSWVNNKKLSKEISNNEIVNSVNNKNSVNQKTNISLTGSTNDNKKHNWPEINKEYKIIEKIKWNCFWIDYNKELSELTLIPKEVIKQTKDYCDKLNQQTLEHIKLYEEQQKKLKNLDFSMCNWLKWWLKENCYMKIVFSKYNKQDCNLIKNKDTNLYQKCLEIKKWIETWKKIRKYQYYYEEYWQNNY